MTREEIEALRHAGRESREAWARENGRPPQITDPNVLEQVAAIVRGGEPLRKAA